MKSLVAAAASGVLVALTGLAASGNNVQPAAARPLPTPPRSQHSEFQAPTAQRLPIARPHTARPTAAPPIPADSATAIVHRTCGGCHSEAKHSGDLVLEQFDVAGAAQNAETAEKMIAKLRAGMMPAARPEAPGRRHAPDARRPRSSNSIDAAAAANPDPGTRTFQRLNRAEYERSIHDLLGLDVDAGNWLPLDTKSANFDNIADVQMPSATLARRLPRRGERDQPARRGRPARRASTSTTYKTAATRIAVGSRGRRARRARAAASRCSTPSRPTASTSSAVTLHAIPTGQLFGSVGTVRREGRDLGERRARCAARTSTAGCRRPTPTAWC